MYTYVNTIFSCINMSIDKVDFTIHNFIIICDLHYSTNLNYKDSSSDVTLIYFKMAQKTFKTLFLTQDNSRFQVFALRTGSL